ncbi:MAG: hypothetical protein IPL12_05120 [Bacteroidetes bacterium]|nr:hypothetical protein [Bacteroidota bacterium]
MYHLLLQPSNIADTDGKYRGVDDKNRFSAKQRILFNIVYMGYLQRCLSTVTNNCS